MRLASASSCCELRNRNDGSGLMLNGFWVKPKNALYIVAARQILSSAYHVPRRQPSLLVLGSMKSDSLAEYVGRRRHATPGEPDDAVAADQIYRPFHNQAVGMI